MSNFSSAYMARTMSKSEMAGLYMPELCPRHARLVLTRWIERSPGLLDRLAATGYTKKQKLFTPAQVGLIMEAIGEP